MVSLQSIKTFFYINTFLFGIGYLLSVFDYFFISYLIRNYVLMYFISYGTNSKDSISMKPKKYNILVDHLHVFSSTFVESVTNLLIQENNKDICPAIIFLPVLFLFECILDFFHYIFHRHFHTNEFLYKHIHKKHHYHQNLSVINTYYHNPIDIIYMVSIPSLISLYILPYKFSSIQKEIIFVYKSFIEISGHCGKNVKASSFPLCIWLPKLFGIDLYTHNHDTHHERGDCNYAKRFSLWDKLFGTYL